MRTVFGVWSVFLFFLFFGSFLGSSFFDEFFCFLEKFVFVGGFDSGSGRTLAACLTHASRTMKRGLFVFVD